MGLRVRSALVMAGLVVLGVPATAWPLEILANGGFEAGVFSPWTRTLLGAGSCDTDWTLCTSGAASGCIGFAPYGSFVSPVEGRFAAYNSFDGNGPQTFRLQQAVIVPTGVASATLQWTQAVGIGNAGSGGLPRTFLVQILDATASSVLATVDSQSYPPGPGQTLFQDWNARTFDVTAVLQSLEGATIRLAFSNVIPQSFTGPASFALDAVSLDVQLVPEPGSALLLGSGLLGIGSARRGRRRLAAAGRPLRRRATTTIG